jgi:hypothetical protein
MTRRVNGPATLLNAIGRLTGIKPASPADDKPGHNIERAPNAIGPGGPSAAEAANFRKAKGGRSRKHFLDRAEASTGAERVAFSRRQRRATKPKSSFETCCETPRSLDLDVDADAGGRAREPPNEASISGFPVTAEHLGRCRASRRSAARSDRLAVVELIGATTTKTGLKVESALDTRNYQKGIKISKAAMKCLDITGDQFHPEWNYTIRPRPP